MNSSDFLNLRNKILSFLKTYEQIILVTFISLKLLNTTYKDKTNFSSLQEVYDDEGPVDSTPFISDSPFTQQAYYGFITLV